MAFGGFFDTQGKEDRQNNCKAQGRLYFMLCLRLSMQLPYSYIHT